MERVETHRRIESALSIFVVASVLGGIGRGLSSAGQAAMWWLVRTRGWAAAHVAELSLAWSWADALAGVSTVGAVIGLWRLSRSFVGGRVRSLASAALWMFAGSLALSALWQVAAPFLARRADGSMRSIFLTFNLVHYGVFVVASGLWLAALVVLARMTTDGARRAWAGPIVLAALALALEVGWWMAGRVMLLRWPVWSALLGFLVVGAAVAGALALVLPVRRVWRAHRDDPAATFEGPYRTPTPPETSWRDAPELRIAGAGLADVRRRVQSLIVVAMAAIPVMVAATSSGSILAVALALIGLAILHLGIALPLTAGVARYTRAPAELPGRTLGISALLCQSAALLCGSKSLLGLIASLAGSDQSQSTAVSASMSAGVAALLGTVLLIVSLGRAARSLGDAETARRARIALAVHGIASSVVVLAGLAVARSHTMSLEALAWLVPSGWFLATVVCMATYAWLLSAAARMPGFVASADPPVS